MNALALTRDLLRYDTINPPGEEQACARHVGRLLEDAGFAVAEYEFGERRTSLVARLGGRAGHAPPCASPDTSTWCRSAPARGRTSRSRARSTAPASTAGAPAT